MQSTTFTTTHDEKLSVKDHSLPKMHVIGYPFAGGQTKEGANLSPGVLRDQEWFKE
jgi:spore germination protein GerM